MLLRPPPPTTFSPTTSARLTAAPLTLIGVGIALAGNVLIALALNVQKLAHNRLQKLKQHQQKHQQHQQHEQCLHRQLSLTQQSATHEAQQAQPAPPTEHVERGRELSPHAGCWQGDRAERVGGLRGDDFALQHGRDQEYAYGTFFPRMNQRSTSDLSQTTSPSNLEASAASESPQCERRRPISYLRSRLWWLGVALMTLGETGNFISYGFAPASLIAPLGSAALLANTFLAPLVVGELVGWDDFVGAGLCALGAAGVVCSVPTRDTSGSNSDIGDFPPPPLLDTDGLVEALKQKAFVLYVLTDLGVCLVLALASLTPLEDKTWLVDLGVCACLGSLTALATKSLSEILTQGGIGTNGGWAGILSALKHPVLLFLLGVLVSTAVGQVAFLNRALQRFDASRVIPTHFTLFTLSVIAGSAVLFRDFQAWPFFRVLGFLLACSLTFGGVYVLAHQQKSPSQTQPHSFDPSSQLPEGQGLYARCRSAPPMPEHGTLPQSAVTYADASMATPQAMPNVPDSEPRTTSVVATSHSPARQPRQMLNTLHNQPIPIPPTSDPCRTVRPWLRPTATDTELFVPPPTADSFARNTGLTAPPDRATRGPRRYLARPAMALSTGHYLLLPLDASKRILDHPAVTRPIWPKSHERGCCPESKPTTLEAGRCPLMGRTQTQPESTTEAQSEADGGGRERGLLWARASLQGIHPLFPSSNRNATRKNDPSFSQASLRAPTSGLSRSLDSRWPHPFPPSDSPGSFPAPYVAEGTSSRTATP